MRKHLGSHDSHLSLPLVFILKHLNLNSRKTYTYQSQGQESEPRRRPVDCDSIRVLSDFCLSESWDQIKLRQNLFAQRISRATGGALLERVCSTLLDCVTQVIYFCSSKRARLHSTCYSNLVDVASRITILQHCIWRRFIQRFQFFIEIKCFLQHRMWCR
jgi:hypothetical protein